MSVENEGSILYFKVDVDEMECPSCKNAGTLCLKEHRIDENHVAFQIHCMNPECWGKNWGILIGLVDRKPEQWQMENADENSHP